jgi:hypothetical protein
VIVRRYGTTVQSVQPDFDANAMNEIGFRRDDAWSMPADAFLHEYERTEAHELTAVKDGPVQSECEAALLRSLHEQLMAVHEAAGDGMLLIENEQVDYPKTRHTQTTHVVEDQNRLHFRYRVEPPLRVAVYRRK